MKRLIKKVVVGICLVSAVCVLLWLLLLWNLMRGSGSTTETRILPAEELSGCLTHLSPNIQVSAGFAASSYGGWHGDGGSVTIYLVDPDGAEALIEGLKQYHKEQRKNWPDHYRYEWSESPRPAMSALESLIPARFQPPAGNYVIGRERSGNDTISVEKQKGYVCFATSRS